MGHISSLLCSKPSHRVPFQSEKKPKKLLCLTSSPCPGFSSPLQPCWSPCYSSSVPSTLSPLDLTLPSSLPGTLSPGIFTLIPFLPSRRLSQSLSRQLTSNSNPFFHHFPSPGSFSLLTSRYYRIHVTSCFFSFSHPRRRSLCLTHCWNPEQCLQCFRIVQAFSPNSNDVDTTSTLLILATEET